MPKLQVSSLPKRESAEQAFASRSLQPPPKRRKLDPPTCKFSDQPPAAFWDNLSKISLTRRSLRELDRRNAQSALIEEVSSCRKLRRPLTRYARTKLTKRCWPFKLASEFLCDCTADCSRDLKRLASHGGPNLTRLRGHPHPGDLLTYAMSSSQSHSRGRKRPAASISKVVSTQITSTKNTTTYDRNFQQHLIDHGIYPEGYEHPNGQEAPIPNNWDEIKRRLTQPRASLSPSRFSDQDFKEFRRADTNAFKEKQVTISVIPIIEGAVAIGRCVAGDIPFSNLDHLTDGTIVPGKPDLFYGARPEQLDRRIRLELSSRIIPSTQDDLPMSPNFFLEVKGPDGSPVIARRQACYDGALGARALHSLQSYRQEAPAYDGNAYTITSTYSDGTLKLYTHHPTQLIEPGGKPVYYMKQLRAFAITDDAETFRQGATAYRNSRDWAMEKREEFIEAANGRAGIIYTPSESVSFNAEASVSTAERKVTESETSADELALDDEEMCTSFTKRPRREHPETRQTTEFRGRSLGNDRSLPTLLAS